MTGRERLRGGSGLVLPQMHTKAPCAFTRPSAQDLTALWSPGSSYSSSGQGRGLLHPDREAHGMSKAVVGGQDVQVPWNFT